VGSIARIDGLARSSRLERLSPLDASNLRVEDHGLPIHATALVIFEGHLIDALGPPPSLQ